MISQLRRLVSLFPHFAGPQWLPIALGIGGALLGGLGAAGQPKNISNTSTQTFDPVTQQFRDSILGATQAAAGGPVPPHIQQALSQLQGYGSAGALGASALGGNQSAIQSLMNPYQSQVIGQTGQYFNRLRDQATLDTNDMATRAQAFGGSRHGVALGRALGDLYSQEGQTVAGLHQQGYNDAMNRAQASAGLGLSAFQQLPGYSNMADPNMRALGIWQQGMQGLPVGGTVTNTGPNPNKQNPFIAAAGGAISGYTLGGGRLPGFSTGNANAGSIWNWGGGQNG